MVRTSSGSRFAGRNVAACPYDVLPPGSEGGYRFACSGDAASFRELGSRFLQMPLGDVTVVDPEAVPAATGQP